ncbi:MAG: DUF86 domain-containing protein [Bacteroidetes bacterium]|nr:DUF86 domain-containing protein [Bacteroidota bacterium]MBU1116001.1 DUF86 domain-containing protein [Bacteroidota bacterium]MBU1799231.1 DUF86 domain-containing protein [Bacteroidota bacterium]
MYDKELVISILEQIYVATQKVNERFSSIKSVEDFTNSNQGMVTLDAICMQLIAIGESLKNIDKMTNSKLLNKYPNVDWKGAKGMRDIISHHYFDIDAEQIFWVCEKNIPHLSVTINKIIEEIG